ncbi:hypothetical protein KRX52_05740 [Pseudomonas sp. MAP12]|uniref:Uncharacterized protein n=1 Tax=Geopseudomonas aromaticivorans TaxID=2849492 RepID=A0ABS6MVK8_9GAMM|nr:hypothetical protein [Pseudomonas aromaticivorans]MBV2132302.1 hypothetical protein [Pseudomonas aromaticivorans]
MRDPHVEAVYFTVGSADDISYENPEPVEFSNHLGQFSLADGLLTVIPAEHFSCGQEASQALDGFLRSWEIEADLKRNVGMIRFSYSRADVIDRDPPPPGEPQVIQAVGIASLAFGSSVTCHLVAKRYPSPPECFSANEYAQHAYRRWIGYRNGREPLQAMAYFIVTLMESLAGGSRGQACELFRIDRPVRKKIGDLCSEKGSALTARKAQSTTFEELTHIESEWLEMAVKRLIYRLGEYAPGHPLELITMENIGQL